MRNVRMMNGMDGVYFHVGDLVANLAVVAVAAKGKDGEAAILAICEAVKEAALNPVPLPITW